MRTTCPKAGKRANGWLLFCGGGLRRFFSRQSIRFATKLKAMMKEKIRELLEATPFVPFFIHTAGGKTVRVHHPDFVLAASDAPHVVVEEPNGRIHTLNIMLITSLEQDPAQPSETV
jgi:hypothetical protein